MAKSKLTEDEQQHLAELLDVTERLEAVDTPEAKKISHQCNEVLWDIACGCEADVSAGVLSAARELLDGAA